MTKVTFYELGSNRNLGSAVMACVPAAEDFVVLPREGDHQWQVQARLFRPVGNAAAWRHEEVELWVSLVA